MTSFKRWFGAGAIAVLVLALIACPAAVEPPPTIAAEIPDMDFAADDRTARTVSLGNKFTGATNATYTATVAPPSGVVTATVSGSTLTVTPVAAGVANVTVTAKGDEGSVAQTFKVTINAPEPDPVRPDPNQAPTSNPIPDQTLTVVDDPMKTLDLSMYFDDADADDVLTYGASSNMEMYATATVEGSTLTITAVAAGTARVTVTATDGKVQVPASRSFNVRVLPENNKPPEVVTGTIRTVGGMVGESADPIDLSRYFTDPEGDSLEFNADSSDDSIATATVEGSMLTVGLVAVGKATIEVTASDGMSNNDEEPNPAAELVLRVTVTATPNVAPEVSMEIPDQSLEMDFMATDDLDLSMYFSDSDSGPSALEYTAVSDMEMYATAMVEGSTLTITAVAAGTATITVTASDGADEVMDTFTVTVTSPSVPEATSELPDQTFDHDDMTERMFRLSDFFLKATGYMVGVEPEGVVEAVEAEGELTLTPVAAGRAVVTVTPSNSGGSGSSQTITVFVESAPLPMSIKPLPSQRFPSDAEPMMITLSEYFSGATGYEAVSNTPTVLMAAAADGMLTLTPVMYGMASVTVTPSNSGGNGTAQTFNVTVQAKPSLKKDMEFENRNITVVPDPFPPSDVAGADDAARLVTLRAVPVDTDPAETTAARAAFNAAAKRYMLTDYITDLDGEDSELEFSATTTDPKVVAVYSTPEMSFTVPTSATLNKMMVEDSDDITILGRKVGTATITVTAKDGDTDMLMKSWMFMVTVAATNTAPTVVATGTLDGDAAAGTTDATGLHFPGAPTAAGSTNHRYHDFAILADRGRFLSTGEDNAVKKLKVDLATLFVDPDVEVNQRSTGDTWEFSATSDNKDVVTVDLESTDNRTKPDEHNVVITRVGSGDATITLKVTDSFGESAMHTFAVKVNHAPMAQGSQDEPMTLGNAADEEVAKFRKLSDAPAAIAAVTIDLADYFSDKDSDDALWCSGNKRGDEKVTSQLAVAIDNTANERTLTLTAAALTGDAADGKRSPGIAYLDVICADRTDSDGSGAIDADDKDLEEAMATLTVEIVKSRDFSIGR